MLQQLPQNPIFCRFLLKKNIFDEKKFKKNQKIKIGQFSISAWLEARFSSYDQKTANLGKQVYTLTTGGFCTVQLCLLFIDGATGCFYLPSTFDLSSLTLNEQLRRGELMAGYLYLFQVQDLDWDPDSLEQNWVCGNFPPLCLDGKIPTDPVLLQWIWRPIQILHLKKV